MHEDGHSRTQATRSHSREVVLAAPPDIAFQYLLEASAIRAWWGASRALVMPEVEGTWAAAWGPENDPEYLTIARIQTLERPRVLALGEIQQRAYREGPLPYPDSSLQITFTIEPHPEGSRLQVVHAGFPLDPETDEAFAACERGWETTLESFRQFVAARPHD